MAPTIRKIKDCGPLQDLLIKACPPMTRLPNGKFVRDPDGFKSVAILAHTLGLSAWGVQKWINKGRIPPDYVMKIVDNNPEEVTIAQFSPFVYGFGS